MKSIKTCNIEDLNRQTRDYLRGIWRKRGAAHPGVFIHSHRVWRSVAGFVAGLLLLTVAAHGLRPESLYQSLGWQCGFVALGVMSLATSGLTLLRRFGSGSIGDFAYFDGSWYWDIGAHRVKVTALRQVFGFQLLGHFRNGVQTKTVVHITLPQNERTSISFASQQAADQFATFLQLCQRIRGQALLGQLSASVQQFVSEPAGLAQAAREVLNSGGSHVSLERARLISIPDPATLRASRFASRRMVTLAALGAAVFMGGWAGFPPLRYAIDHSYHYAKVKASPPTDTHWPQAYLAKFPMGRYHEEVTAILDDRLFAIASSSAEQQHSPAAIRNYLAGQPNERHQEEARRIIARFYDEAIARVRQLVAGQPTDQNLLPGLFAILEHLKSQATPRVTVAFQPRWTVEPTAPLVKLLERKSQSSYATNDVVIERMVQTKGGAIIGTHDTFSEKQVRRRESIILNRLRETIAKILSSDIIVFEQSRQMGDITINYDIKPQGTLRKYVRVPGEGPENATPLLVSLAKSTNTLGLLRDYTIDWRLTIQPGSEGTAYTYQLNSNSGTNLVYRTTPGDPEWGAYAVLLYSAFYDFSNRMLAGAGLTPPPAPTTFSFHDAVNR